MIEIIPAIMPKNYEDLASKARLVAGRVSTVQIDIMDGVFVPNISWPFESKRDPHWRNILREEEGLPSWQEIDYEFDLMITRPDREFETWFRSSGAKRIIIHVESVPDLGALMSSIDETTRENVELSLAISLDTPWQNFRDYFEVVDSVQVMGIARIGFQGEPFDDRVLTRISEIREEFPEKIISVDGGVNFDSAPDLIDAGATRLVVGSAIWEGDIDQNLADFESLADSNS